MLDKPQVVQTAAQGIAPAGHKPTPDLWECVDCAADPV